MRPVTLITGASSGLGAGLAPLFAQDGDTVVCAARRVEKVEAIAASIRDAGGHAVALPLDVCDRAAVGDAFAHVERDIGPIHTIVANAGVGDATPAKSFDAETFEWILRVNVLGVSYCIEAALPSMLERGEGHLVAIGSLAGYRGLPGSAGYCASKAAVIAMMESLRIELVSKGIAVSTICPGFVKTPLTERNRFPMPFLLERDDAARRMHRAIRGRRSEYAFPWPLATTVRLGRYVPNWMYDRLLRGQRAKKAPPKT